MIHSAQLVQLDSEYPMLDHRIISPYLSDKLATYIKYCLADVYNTYIVYSPADVRCHVLINIMSEYYLCYYRVLGLNGVLFESRYRQYVGESSWLIQWREYGTSENRF
jgi:hypothetical protein